MYKTRRTLILSALGLLSGYAGPAIAGQDVKDPAECGLPMSGGNTHYHANREPLKPSPLMKLPVGAIRPEGWLRGQLELMAEGMTGRLTEISRWCNFEKSSWAHPQGHGDFGWEELPYWLKGYINLGYILKNQRIIDESRRWVEAVLASSRDDGYFGPEANRQAHDIWPNMCMLYVLRTFHEATGDPRVIRLMTNYCKWLTTQPFEHLLLESWQKIRAGDNLDSIYWLYNRTGEPWLLDVARVNHERTADWTGLIASWHGVNICEAFREPAQYYQQYQDIRHLKAAYRNYDTVWGLYGQVPGGLFGADENCRPGYVGPRQGAESCSIVEFMHSAQMLLRIGGDIIWADRCEDAAFNSLPCAQTPDYKGLHYLTAPNQIQLDRQSKSPMIQNGGDMFSYSPFEQYRCCQHNIAFGWPYFAENLWMATQANGLAAAFYAACSVTAKVGDGTEVTISEKTDYPFGETVEFKLTTAKAVKFPLALRIPQWCEVATIQINDQEPEAPQLPGTWAVLERTWKDGDRVRLALPMKIRARVWERNHYCVSVDRGPLTYSLKLGEKWVPYGNEKWPGHEVFPTTPWNYGLLIDVQKPESSFRVVERIDPVPAQPFTPDNAPILIAAKGRRIPAWQQEKNGLVGEIQASPVRSEEPVEEITLIPMGCARLRISAFPQIGEGPGAHDWSALATPPTASHCWQGDTTSALNDGILPKSSDDKSIPRFTWYDHLGTREWVQYTFPEPRKISTCEVYWFNDSAAGKCHLPASWKILWWDGNRWQGIHGLSDYPRKNNEFSKVTFKPITTTAIRVEVQLFPDFSAGILEWRVD